MEITVITISMLAAAVILLLCNNIVLRQQLKIEEEISKERKENSDIWYKAYKKQREINNKLHKELTEYRQKDVRWNKEL